MCPLLPPTQSAHLELHYVWLLNRIIHALGGGLLRTHGLLLSLVLVGRRTRGRCPALMLRLATLDVTIKHIICLICWMQ